jgi:hypothetical protein
MNTIDAIVRELEKIPEPIQLSVLEFIRSLNESISTDNNSIPSVGSRRIILGLNRGQMKIKDDFDDPLPDEFWLGEE